MWKKENSWLATSGDAANGIKDKDCLKNCRRAPCYQGTGKKKQQIKFSSDRWKKGTRRKPSPNNIYSHGLWAY